ncbi:hypothetical protein [Phenylobacterium sp.]|jgi:hypothetical protein|uniref:hypothetical protein n=1 Tax=Phenylobacterium sp. TaxID=1871053 RepID=UPI002E372978|nr:hypothetical protein [Phenylobacterium sp.]HEX4710136.1 hypothetical protein [Phenylobacterium sp.]
MPSNEPDQSKGAFTPGSGGSDSDKAAEAARVQEDRHIDTPHAREVEPLKDGEKHDHMAVKEKSAEDRQEALLDEALEETFPSSDPISPKHIT